MHNHRDIMFRLNAALSRVNASYGEIGRRHGLTYNALMMLYTITSERTTQTGLCETLHLPKSTIHSILLEWIQQGYVELMRCTGCKEKEIRLTNVGHAFFDPINKETEDVERRVLEAFGEGKSAAFLHSAETLSELLRKEVHP